MLLGVKRSIFRMHDSKSEDADKEYATIRYEVLKRDAWTCQFCGMRTMPENRQKFSGRFEIHHLDDDHHNNSTANLKTSCPFCHSVFHCGNAGHRESGSIIWAPFIRQEDLNLTSHVLFIGICYGSPSNSEVVNAQKAMNHAFVEKAQWMAKRCREQYVLLQELMDGAEKVLGDGMSNAAVLGEALATLANDDPKSYEKRAAFLYGARFLPHYDYYAEDVEYWRYVNNHKDNGGHVISPDMLEMHLRQIKRLIDAPERG